MYLVSLIVPTYNEAKNLPLLLEEIFSFVDTHEIDMEVIIVDDNSPDGTAAIANELSSRYPVSVIKRSGKLGLGSAVRAGFEKSTRPYVGVMDADLSHDPKIFNELVTSLGQYDIAIGSRFEKGSSVEKWQWWRKLTSLVGVALARLVSGVKDPLSGYFCMRRSVVEGVSLTTTGYKILFEILVKGNYQSVKEIPFQFRVRKFSSSKLNMREYLLFMRQFVEYALCAFKRTK